MDNIKIYEESLGDVDHKFYLTNIQNTGNATVKGTEYFTNRNKIIKPSNFRKTHSNLKTSLLSIDTSGVDENNYGDFILYSMLKLATSKGI